MGDWKGLDRQRTKNLSFIGSSYGLLYDVLYCRTKLYRKTN